MQADASTEAAVKDVLNTFAGAYAARNMDTLLASFAPDSDVIIYGTGADEKRIGRDGLKAQAERDWSQTEAAALSYDWMSISAAGSVAWAATDATFNLKADGQAMSLPARITFVVEKRGEQWLIVQGHLSVPAATQSEGESIPS